MTDNEQLLLDVLDIMKGSQFKYWISQGTLLGLVREGRILPWDNDIDISVWEHEVSQQQVIDMFKPHGFEIEYIPGDVGCIHFKGREKHVDIGFYKAEGTVASIKWVMPGGTNFKKLAQFLLSVLTKEFTYQDIKGDGLWLKKPIFFCINAITKISPEFFQKLHDYLVGNYGDHFFDYLGYSYPRDMLENIGHLELFERKIPVPGDYVKFLELTYGKDWKVPKKSFVWHEEAGNLI